MFLFSIFMLNCFILVICNPKKNDKKFHFFKLYIELCMWDGGGPFARSLAG